MVYYANAIHCEGLSVDRYGFNILNGISFHVAFGERFCISGPIGSGRTTLLRTLAALNPIRKGSMSILDIPLGKPTPAYLSSLGVVYVGENRSLFQSLRISDHYLLIGKSNSSNEILGRVLELMPNLLNNSRKISSLSGGERQIFGIACALARSPRILIVDQISQGVHPDIMQRVSRILIDECERNGVTLVFSDDRDEVVDGLSTRCFSLTHRKRLRSVPNDVRPTR